MGLQNLTFMEKNLENRKKLILVRILNSMSLYGNNIMNSVNTFNDVSIINSNVREQYWDEQHFLWIVPGEWLHPNFQVQHECINSKRIFQFVRGLMKYN